MRFSLNNKKQIDLYSFALIKRQKQIQKRFADELKENLEKMSPKRTGKLASSYYFSINPNSIMIFNDCGYCKYVNDGTRFQVGQHFIQTAYIFTKGRLEEICKQVQKTN